MENKNLVGVVLAITVSLICIGTVMMPVLTDATTTEDTFTNDGFIRMGLISSTDDDVTITWNPADPLVFVIDGEEYEMPTGYTNVAGVYPYTIFASDGWGMRYSYNSSNERVDLNLYGTTDNSLLWFATSEEETTVSITFDSGTATFTKGTSSVTQTYDDVFILDADGDYVLKKTSDSAHVLGDSVIYSTGRTIATFGATVLNVNVHLEGNVSDGIEVSVIAPSGYTASDIQVTSGEVDGYENLYTFDKVTFAITEDSTETTVSATYGQVIVPYEVTAERSVHFSQSENALILIIPVMTILAVLMIAVRVVTRD